MGIEIERKFLLLSDDWRALAEQGQKLEQAYLPAAPPLSLRIRTTDNSRATLTLKTARSGMTRNEFEYDIPLADARDLISLSASPVISKTRYKVSADEKLYWEIDVFEGDNAGLILAEIELPSEDTVFEEPSWLGAEVTNDPRYYNASLATTPFTQWTT